VVVGYWARPPTGGKSLWFLPSLNVYKRFPENFDEVFENFWEALGVNFQRSAEKEIVHALTLKHPPERKMEVFDAFEIQNFDKANVLKFSEEFTDNLDTCLRERTIKGLEWFSVLSSHFPKIYTKAPPFLQKFN